ncbi:hypothetical protein HY500_02245, partial [Candidatus Woesearchaeota archaeon]|nr:hypothetical protein [Candidatus Woesearchaeota archaeon]
MNKVKTIFYQSDTEGLDEVAEALLNSDVSTAGATPENLSVENPRDYIKI